MASNIKGITVEIGGNTTKLGKALEDVNRQTKSLQSELKGVNTLLKSDPSNVVLLKQKQDLLTQSIAETKSKLDTLKEAEAQVQAQFERGEVSEEQYRDLQREIVFTEQKLEKLTDDMKEFGSVGAQQVAQVGESVKDVGGKVESFGKGFSVVSAGTGALLAGSIASFKELDSGYDTIITKTGATGDALEDLNAVADNIFGSMPTDMDTVGVAVGEINTRFGYTGDKLEELSTQFIQFAEINGVDLNNSIGTVDKVLEQFNMDASESGNVLDLITLKAQQTGIGADTLMNSIQQNGATFKEMGLNVNEAVVLLSQFEANGVNVEVAMKSLKKATQEYTEQGLSMEQALGKTIEKIKNAKTDTKALAEAQEIFGTKGAGEMARAIREGRINIEDLSASMKDYEGVVAETYEGTLDPIDQSTVAMNNLKLAGSELASALQTTFAPMLTSIVNKLRDLAQWFGNLSPTMQKTIAVILTIVTALGPVIIVIGKLISSIGTIMTFAPKIVTAFNAIKTAFTGLGAVMAANPIGVIIVAITALVAGLIYAYNHSEKFREIVNNAFTKVKEVASNVVQALVNFFTVTIPNAFESAKNKLVEIGNNIVKFFTDTIPKLISDMVKWFADLPNKIGYAIGFVIGTLVKWGANMVSWVKTNIPIIINNIITFFKQLPSKIWNAIVGAVNKIATWGANMKEKASTAIRNMVSSVISTAQSLPGKIWSAIVGAIDKITTWGSQMLSKAKSAIKNVASAITDGLKNIPSKLGSIGKNIVEGLWNGIKNATGWIKDKVAGFAQGILDGMKDALGIHSPSRVFRDEVGKFIPEGIGVGIEENEQSALNAVDTMSQDLINQAQHINGVTLKRQLETTFKGSVDSNNNILNRLDTIAKKLESKTQIVLDTGVLVGETIDKIDSALATNQSLVLRGV